MTPEDIYHPDDEDYLPFQRAGIAEMELRNNILLADEMGLGKTIQAIGYINKHKPDNVLVVCPNSLRLNWLAELDKWLAPDLKMKYEIDQCTTPLWMPTNFTVASYDGLIRWYVPIAKHPWNLIILDEMHYIKNPSTKRAKAVFSLQDIECKKIGMTGTPIPNFPYELFPLIHFLDKEQWPNSTVFERRYGSRGPGKLGYNLGELHRFLREGAPKRVVKTVERTKIVRQQSGHESTYRCEKCNIDFPFEMNASSHAMETQHEINIKSEANVRLVPVKEIIGNEEVFEQGIGLMIRRQKKDVLKELPSKRRQIIELPAEGELLKLVEEENRLWGLQKEFLTAIEDAIRTQEGTSDSDFDAIIEGLTFNRRYMFSEISRIRHALALAKVPYVIEHLEDLLENKEKVVVFCHHNDVANLLHEHWKQSSVLVYGPTKMEDRFARIKKFWEDDECELFIGSLKTSGTGINLQNAANIVFAELDWVPGTITQAEDRCHRIGQDKSLLVQHLVAQNSMDSNMAKKIVAKQKSIAKALNRL